MDELAAHLSERSLVLPLSYVVGMDLDLVAPGGTTADTHRPGLVIFGPLSWTVLASLWSVGYPARAEEIAEVQDTATRAIATPIAIDADGQPVSSIRRALALWRVLAATSTVNRAAIRSGFQ